MNRVFLCLVVMVLAGCSHSKPTSSQEVLARVGNYTITREEFEDAYKDSSDGSQGTPASRRAFLDNMIDQKLIILDAESRGLDKNKEFLKMIESFWQQSLLTMAMQDKAREGVNIDDWVASLKKNTTIEINEKGL